MQTTDKESTLARIFNEQLTSYQKALTVIEEIESKFSSRVDAQTELETLNSIMTVVAAQDTEVRQLRDEVFSTPETLSSEMRDISLKLQATVETMLGRVQHVEDIARTIRDGLRPQISEQVNARRMVDAYKTK